LVGSILPDFDLIWFYAIDARAFHHHLYWTHMPAFWAVLAVPIWLAGKYLNQPLAALGFLLAIGLHLFLDSLVGGAAWLWPVSAHLFSMAEVPATHANWILSFVFHWSFLLELLIIFSALFLAISQNRKPPHA
jgi:hypothetical protein